MFDPHFSVACEKGIKNWGPVPRDFVHPGAFQHCASAHKSPSDTGQMPKINLQSLDPSNGHWTSIINSVLMGTSAINKWFSHKSCLNPEGRIHDDSRSTFFGHHIIQWLPRLVHLALWLKAVSTKTSRHGGAMTSVPCGRCQVIQDVANGWEGFCLGLQLLNRSTTPEDWPKRPKR